MTEFVLPTPHDVLEAEMHDGVRLRVRQHGNPKGPRCLLCHGNGFATNAYYPFWRHLEADYELLIYDQRNHGENPYSGGDGHHLDGFRRDLVSLLSAIPDHFGEKSISGVFHSVSAVTALSHATLNPWPWHRLVLFDPPLVPAPNDPWHEPAFGGERFLAGWALQRQDEFDSPEALAEYFAAVKDMQAWVPGAHALLAQSLLHEVGQRWCLTCPRELEANVYLSNAHARVWEKLERLSPYRDRLLVLSADPERDGARYPPKVASHMRRTFGFNVQAVEDTTHMLQLEQPRECAELVKDFVTGP